MISNPRHASDDIDWEMMWAPYDQQTYRCVLEKLTPNDIVLEIGAGDLRLSRSIAQIVRHVYAIEIQSEILKKAEYQTKLENLTVIHDDARTFPFPGEITTGVLLMRHCTHFQLYANKLKSAGCQRLITNARWRLGVEEIELQPAKSPYAREQAGWYACWCGCVGFNPCPAEEYTQEIDAQINEVINCPHCSNPD